MGGAPYQIIFADGKISICVAGSEISAITKDSPDYAVVMKGARDAIEKEGVVGDKKKIESLIGNALWSSTQENWIKPVYQAMVSGPAVDSIDIEWK